MTTERIKELHASLVSDAQAAERRLAAMRQEIQQQEMALLKMVGAITAFENVIKEDETPS